jgi:soluble lytic murein transglycosylase-like protein
MRVARSSKINGIAIAAVAAAALSWCATAAHADVYYYKDAAGVFHFTNVARPDAAPFIVEAPLSSGRSTDDGITLGRRVQLDSKAYDEIIGELADAHDVEPALVKAVIRAESGFNHRAISAKGARGLMQLMPNTARNHGCRNVYDPRQNIEAGIKHLRLLLDRHGKNLPRVLAAYNAGSEAVNRYNGIPPYAETRTYVSRVLRFRNEYLRKERLEQFARRS